MKYTTYENNLLSIIIPIYNAEKYLEACLKSILMQDYDNFEVILVNDGSIDSSPDICNRYVSHDLRVKYICQENAGAAAARNTGLSHARGEFITFADADDWVEQGMYSSCISRIKNESADAAFAAFYVDSSNDSYVRHSISTEEIVDAKVAMKEVILLNGMGQSAWNKVFRRQALIKDNEFIEFNTAYPILEDRVWLINVIKNTSKFVFVNTPYYHWNRWDGSSSTKDSRGLSEKMVKQFDALYESVVLLEDFDDEECLSFAKDRCINRAMKLLFKAYARGGKGSCFLTYIKFYFKKECNVVVQERKSNNLYYFIHNV